MARKKSIREIANQASRIMAASIDNQNRVNRVREIGMRYLKSIDNKRKSGSVTRRYVRNTYMGIKSKGAVAG